MRPLRYIPPGGSIVEVTTRTLQGRFLLRPEESLNPFLSGVLARAARKYKVPIFAAAFLSNHYHLLLWADDASQLARFMNYLNGNLAREIARVRDWQEKVWSRRYTAILVTGEASAQIARLKYVLSHGAKEGLVPNPLDWPGVHCARALVEGRPMRGIWIDRTRMRTVRRSAKPKEVNDFTTEETLQLSPLPCWEHLDPNRYRERIRELLAAIESEAVTTRQQQGKRLPSRRRCIQRILRQDPHRRSRDLKKRPHSLVHAISTSLRKKMQRRYSRFVEHYRAAAAKLKAGETGVHFPFGCFPPSAPFVAASGIRAP